ncbi:MULTISPECIES: GTPase Era [Aerococcus]|uniref:GTPase Era n=1 Tax=Aerococcus TaxID=1375 RepID=UPI0008A534AC|nr:MULTISPECIES: GTPase Era [Aerococcus]MDK6368725.1 GTPase Era [Aerococcus sp. UMB9870]MDK6679273.1 GTPase Era [Aerococcus sp. UMB8608]MDK6685885.1 GTPase Era [Aerococcus sp. UMB8623]MDK6939348.1 GTPase Era [Aerococcus sp. UMB8487]OFK19386.1 GTPase Era [Aerococcus sp. HMSC072A12]
MKENTHDTFKSGFIAIVGRPNVGKSTLMNQIVGQKVAIMSDKAQTTRNKIQAIYTSPHSQMIFIDTPGIHKPKNELDDYMLQSAYQALDEVEAILMLVSADEKIGPGDRFIMDKIKDRESPAFLIVNKTDKVSGEELAAYMADIPNPQAFDQIIPLSALDSGEVEGLIAKLEDLLPEGPQYYPADQLTDHPEYFVVSELIREQILLKTREEIPHSVAVTVDKMQKDELDRVHVYANIIVERKSQKGIIIGKGGKMIKSIGTGARKEIENLLGSKVFLELWVKVEKKWRDKKSLLKEFGYNTKHDY